jgi:hypothetical protein
MSITHYSLLIARWFGVSGFVSEVFQLRKLRIVGLNGLAPAVKEKQHMRGDIQGTGLKPGSLEL